VIIATGGRWQITPGKQHLVQKWRIRGLPFSSFREQENSILSSRRKLEVGNAKLQLLGAHR
jgi:hypothetical protein